MKPDELRKLAADELALLRRVAEAVEAMRTNLCEWGPDANGDYHHNWYIVAPCEYGEAVDEALAAWRKKFPEGVDAT